MGDKCQLPPVNEKLSMIYDFDYDQHIQNVLTNIRNHNQQSVIPKHTNHKLAEMVNVNLTQVIRTNNPKLK